MYKQICSKISNKYTNTGTLHDDTHFVHWRKISTSLSSLMRGVSNNLNGILRWTFVWACHQHWFRGYNTHIKGYHTTSYSTCLSLISNKWTKDYIVNGTDKIMYDCSLTNESINITFSDSRLWWNINCCFFQALYILNPINYWDQNIKSL